MQWKRWKGREEMRFLKEIKICWTFRIFSLQCFYCITVILYRERTRKVIMGDMIRNWLKIHKICINTRLCYIKTSLKSQFITAQNWAHSTLPSFRAGLYASPFLSRDLPVWLQSCQLPARWRGGVQSRSTCDLPSRAPGHLVQPKMKNEINFMLNCNIEWIECILKAALSIHKKNPQTPDFTRKCTEYMIISLYQRLSR